MAHYAVIDTNVLVSALLSSHRDTATVLIIGKIFTGEVIPVYSEEIINEYIAVLKRPKFNFSYDLVDLLIKYIQQRGEEIKPKSTGEILPDMKDLPFYEVVVERQDDNAYLVTGNLKHFPVRPFIVTAREFLNIINSKDL